MRLTDEVRALIASGRLAHFVTINADGSPHVTIVWVGNADDGGDDGRDEIVIGKLTTDQKVRNIWRDPRVSLSIEADGSQHGMQNYVVIEGTATVTEGGAPELLQRLAEVYVGPGTKFPPMPDPPAGFVLRVTPRKVRGMGPWGTQLG